MKTFIVKNLSISVLASLLFLFCINSFTITAQNVSPAVMQMVSGELQKRGLTEAEVRARLLQKGIDLENVPKAELPNYQTRVMAVLDELQAEKKGGQTATSQQVSPEQTGKVASSIVPNSQISDNKPAPKTTPQEAAAEASQRVIQAAAAKNDEGGSIYGHSLFTDKSLDVFRTTDGAQAPDTYVLGEGDEVHITIFGASQTDIQQRITTDGSIQPSGVAKLFLKGLTLAQAREMIKNKLSSSYLFRTDQIAVTIVTARTIMVNVFGEAKMTGSYNLSALNSAFNALAVAGGPSKIGSVRNIQLIRGNSRKNIDLYAFMNNPAVQFRFDLQNNDILFVPVIQKLVGVEGAVNRPMAYEMTANETLTDLFQFAGGLKMDAYPSFVQIKRFVGGEERLLEWDLEKVLSGKTKVQLKNGDVVRVKSIGKPMDQYVDIEGSVYYPGRFDLSGNATLSTLLNNAKPTYQAKTDLLFVERYRPDETIQLLTIPFPDAKKGVADFDLQARDRIRIVDQAAYRDVASISVNGYVRNPFEKTLALNDRLTVKEAIEMAGGLKTSAYPVAYIFRKNVFNPSEIKYIRIELAASEKVELQPGDQLNVYDNTTFANIGELRVFGAVKNPKGFTYDASMTVRDLITNAGGFTVGAAYNRVEVFRTTLSPTASPKLEIITLEVNTNYEVVSPQGFTLQPYDQLVVRLTPEFTLGRTVELSGQVKYPGTYILESRQMKLSDVIAMAGGLLDDADPYGTSLFRTYKNRGSISMNVEKAVRRKNRLRYNPILFEGDVININRIENTVTILETGTRMGQYSINTEKNKNIVYQGNKSAGWYINNYAGGFQKNADRLSVTVTYPNNQVESTSKFLCFRRYPRVVPGSTIALKMDVEKVKEELEPEKKKDLESTISKALSTLISTLSIILLLQKM